MRAAAALTSARTQVADVLLDLPLVDGAPAVCPVEAVLALGAADRWVHQVLNAHGLGGVRDVLALPPHRHKVAQGADVAS
jgi:hypothetical protein